MYKDADTPWNQTKLNLGLVLKDGLLKENIDGEALIWASRRLRKGMKKKILIVISDGAPVDDATLSSNNSNILIII